MAIEGALDGPGAAPQRFEMVRRTIESLGDGSRRMFQGRQLVAAAVKALDVSRRAFQRGQLV